MLARIGLGLVSVLVFAPAIARAEQSYVDIEKRLTPEQVRATGLATLTVAQLELLNALLRDETAKTSASSAPRADDGHGRGQQIGLDDRPIRTRLNGSVSGWQPGTVFELENGQQWKVLKGSAKLRVSLDSPEVVVVPGIAGRWFLQVDEDMPKARVYRTD